jgi:phosphatidylserine synthase 2
MTYYDSSLGVSLPERSYAEACVLTWDNVKVKYNINYIYIYIY